MDDRKLLLVWAEANKLCREILASLVCNQKARLSLLLSYTEVITALFSVGSIAAIAAITSLRCCTVTVDGV